MSAAATGPAPRPSWLPVNPAGIPRELTDREAWYPAIIKPKAGKVGKYDKIPGDPTTGQAARWSDPTTRCTFGAAFMAHQSGRFPGIGYMLDADAGVVGIDVDEAFADAGALKPHAREIVDAFPGAYWERSVSGRGLRGFCKGSLPVGGCRSKIDGCSVEIYTDERFLVVTGQALRPADTLPTLQDAVDGLHARLTAGRVRATGTAVATSMTGRNADPSPEAFAIVEDLVGGPHAAQLSEIWGRDDLHAAGASEQDWALEKEAVKVAMARGYAGDALARIVEEVVRAGPYRKKWDEVRGGVTWLAQDIANAIETVKEERKKVAELVFEEDTAPADPLETPEQIIARLERELARVRARSAAQETIIRAQRAENEELRARFRGIVGVMENPELRGNEKIIGLRLVSLAHSALDRADQAAGPPEGRVDLTDLGRRGGVSGDAAGRALDLLSGPDGPFEKRCRVEMGPFEDRKTGKVIPYKKVLSVTPRAQTVTGTLAALQAFTPRRERPNDWGGLRTPRCELHPDARPIRRTTLICGEPGCERILDQRDERPKPQDAVLAPAPPERGWVSLQRQDAVLVAPIVAPVADGQPGGNGCAPEGDAHDRAALEMAAAPPRGDRGDGDRDYARARTVDSGAPRLITSKGSANGHAPPAPPGPCTCGEVVVREVSGRYLCAGCGGAPAPLEAGP